MIEYYDCLYNYYDEMKMRPRWGRRQALINFSTIMRPILGQKYHLLFQKCNIDLKDELNLNSHLIWKKYPNELVL